METRKKFQKSVRPTAVSTSDTPGVVVTDPLLAPYEHVIRHRMDLVGRLEEEIDQEAGALREFACGYEFFGFHRDTGEWVFREWAPNARAIYLVGEFSGWEEREDYRLTRLDAHGTWEISLPAKALSHQDLYRLSVHWDGGHGARIPAYARRVVQDPQTEIFNAQIWVPPNPYSWKQPNFVRPKGPPVIYEAHIGMAQDAGKIGSYKEFQEFVLPRIIKAGYNTIQLMAIQEHPYYASFGYQVSSFFAPCSRFGTPEELKALIDAAHNMGVAVIMDLVHSHSVRNEVEGLGRFDGTDHQYFHTGLRGTHSAWGSRCFDYSKKEVLHFLLSNCRYWLEEYRFDGFRFDGVTSMLYTHHGLNRIFSGYEEYFGPDVDADALVYLSLANRLIHLCRPDALTIAEDMSGMPGMAVATDEGGIGFDYRLGMGLPDLWIRLIKHVEDERWHMGEIWYELNNRRQGENTIAYAESHDQALVGDQTLIFRLAGKKIYSHMAIDRSDPDIDRAMAVHKMLRLITIAAAGDGYLNFMGNEFGHPEWIDFPREGNNWSFHYARRQWHLRDAPDLRYRFLAEFDAAMLALARESRLLDSPVSKLLFDHNDDNILSFGRADLIFVFNFAPVRSYADYRIQVPAGVYRLVLDTDREEFGGHDRIVKGQEYFSVSKDNSAEEEVAIRVYVPARTAIVLARNLQLGE